MKTTLNLMLIMLVITLHIGETNAQTTTTNQTNYFKITTPSGYLQIGPGNTGFSHFVTDRVRFYFNKPIYVNGSIHSYIGKNLSIGTHGQSQLTILESNGNVGIGTLNPNYTLEIAHNKVGDWKNAIRLNSNNPNKHWLFYMTTNGLSNWSGFHTQSDNIHLILRDATGFAQVSLRSDGGNTYFNTGNVGIGTTSPDSKLTVKGDIHTNEVKVDLEGAVAPDFVFDNDYDLLSLPETEAYIKQNHHLPQVPSAAEMEANGIELGKMNMLLLQKIEELTLHQIEQHKNIQLLLQKVAAQEKEITELKNN